MKVLSSLIIAALLGAASVSGEVYRVALKKMKSQRELYMEAGLPLPNAMPYEVKEDGEVVYKLPTLRHKYGGLFGDANPSSALVVLHDFQNAEYHGELTIGGQNFAVIWDTGSSNVWVPGTKCDSCGDHVKYDSAKSGSFKEDGRSFDIAYGSGPVSGFLSTDDAKVGSLAIPELTFAEVTNAAGLGMAYSKGRFDGLVGLGWPSIAVNGVEPLFSRMVRLGLVTKPVFTFFLGQQHEQDGELVLGDIDTTRFKGDIFYVPLMATNYWSVKLDAMKLGEENLTGEAMAIVDSGTSLIAGPSHHVAALAEKIGATPMPQNPALNIISCEKRDSLPDIVFTMNGRDFAIKPEDYLISVGEIPGLGKQCLLGFMAMDTPSGDMWILGDVFMRKYFTVFDYGNKQVGFAEPDFSKLPAPNSASDADADNLGARGPAVEASEWHMDRLEKFLA